MPLSIGIAVIDFLAALIISQVVWLYFRFSVSYRDVEEMMAMRGVQLS